MAAARAASARRRASSRARRCVESNRRISAASSRLLNLRPERFCSFAMYADRSLATRAFAARSSRFDIFRPPPRRARADSRREARPPWRDAPRLRLADLPADRPRPFFAAAYPSNVTEPISVMRRTKVNDMSANLGERITLADFFSRREGRGTIVVLRVTETVRLRNSYQNHPSLNSTVETLSET